MSLMDHAMNILGACRASFKPSDIKAGHTVTKVEWHGCMAIERKVVDVGEILWHQASLHNNGRYPGVVVKYDKRGQTWEPCDHFRQVNGELEVWT